VWKNLLLLACNPDPASNTSDVRIKANVAYSYANIFKACEEVRDSAKWVQIPEINALKFNHSWIYRFLQRSNFSRRVVSKENKKTPSRDEVIKQMKIGQDEIIRGNYAPDQIGNMDETAIHCSLGIKYQYNPKTASRASNIPNADDKERVTSIVTALASGKSLPLFTICKHSKSSLTCPDQTSMKIISILHRAKGFRDVDGWEERIWTHQLPNPIDPSVLVTHKVRYIIHTETGHVVTSQVKAWNDEIRCLMYVDLIICRYMEKMGLGSFLLWMDNFSVHTRASVVNYLRSRGIFPAFYPANFTDEIQVCDLIINKLIKQEMRAFRADEVYDYLQECKGSFSALSSEQQLAYIFSPPKPKLHDGLNKLMGMFNENGKLQQEAIQQSIRKCFIDTGAAPMEYGQELNFHEFQFNNNNKHNKPLFLPFLPADIKVFNVDDQVIDPMEKQQLEVICDNLMDIFVEGVVPYPDLNPETLADDDENVDDCIDHYQYNDSDANGSDEDDDDCDE
jgi:hypothetical protein